MSPASGGIRSATPEYAPLDEPRDAPPSLLVVVDTEEEFDWSAPFDRGNDRVRAMNDIGRAQAVFDEFGIRPTYVIDHPVATQPEGYEPLRAFADSGRAQIGAHLHPWVSPPFEEEVCARNSYPGNLPRELQRAKLGTLVAAIEASFGARPTLYKAGRYGLGPDTAELLVEAGFEIDLSVCAGFDLRGDGGPDWSRHDARPFRFGPGRALLGLPTTGGFLGAAGALSPALHGFASRPPLRSLRLPGILSRLGVVERLMLSPEGHALDDLVRLTRGLLRRGLRTFSFTFHSPSMRPGCTPYVGNERELHEFLDTCRRYFEFFLQDLGGSVATPHEVRARLTAATSRPA